MRKKRTLEELEQRPDLIDRFFKRLKIKGFYVPFAPGGAWIAFKQFFGERYA